MSRRLVNRLFLCAGLLLSGLSLSAQSDGTYSGYSPYSIYGVGDLHTPGTAYNATMGGVGIATRNKRFVNILNPASVTARDSLSFMADFGLSGRGSLFVQGDRRNVNTLFNINNFVISFPLWRRTAFMVGITPFSDTGYKMSYRKIDGNTGTQTYASAGSGSINQLFAGGAAMLTDRLSVGAQYQLLFGNLNKETSVTFGDASYRSHSLGDTLQVVAHTVKFGTQYEQPLPSGKTLTFGATYRLRARMRGEASRYSTISELDLGQRKLYGDKVYFGDELGVGIAFRNRDVWSFEVDYLRSDWKGCNLDATAGFRNNGISSFSGSVAQSVKAGFEITPNRNDIRYFLKRCTYRAGTYFDQSYYQVDGKPVNTVGLTLGMTLPVFRGYNGLTVGLDLGQRGFGGAIVKEDYIGFNIGFNIFDIWFQKPRYE